MPHCLSLPRTESCEGQSPLVSTFDSEPHISVPPPTFTSDRSTLAVTVQLRSRPRNAEEQRPRRIAE
jgi:hypothetical protein